MNTIKTYFPCILNSELVFQFFGFWPSLNDAEILRIILDRELGFDFSGPKMILDVYACADWLSHNPSVRKGCKISFEFENLRLDALSGFNHQNATNEFEVDDYIDPDCNQVRYKIRFGSVGAHLLFSCRTMSVLACVPFDPPDYFMAEGGNSLADFG